MKKEVEHGGKVRVSQKFVIALAVVSILGFAGIVSETLFNKNITYYIESLWMLVIGIGVIVESQIKKLKSLAKGLTPSNFTNLTTIIIGVIAIVAGIFSFPPIRVEASGFLAIKGIVSIIAIAVIIIQTWIAE